MRVRDVRVTVVTGGGTGRPTNRSRSFTEAVQYMADEKTEQSMRYVKRGKTEMAQNQGYETLWSRFAAVRTWVGS